MLKILSLIILLYLIFRLTKKIIKDIINLFNIKKKYEIFLSTFLLICIYDVFHEKGLNNFSKIIVVNH